MAALSASGSLVPRRPLSAPPVITYMASKWRAVPLASMPSLDISSLRIVW